MEDTPKIHDVRNDTDVHTSGREGDELGRLIDTAKRNDLCCKRSDDGCLCSVARQRKKVMWDMSSQTTAEQAAQNRLANPIKKVYSV